MGNDLVRVVPCKAAAALSAIATVLGCSLVLSAQSSGSSDWPIYGRTLSNTADANSETILSSRTVSRLKTKWVFTTGGDVSARAAVVNGVAYFPDWGGFLWAINTANGKPLWSHRFSDYGLGEITHSRTTPALVGDTLYVGTQEGGWLLALGTATGALKWKMQPDTSIPFPMITSSPVVASGRVYVGMTSNEESIAATVLNYPCCSARGSVVAVDATTGQKLWNTYTVPKGYSGGAVWGSNPAVDLTRRTLYVSTGNDYSIPLDPAFVACMAAGGNEAACLSPDDHIDSVIALDMDTGAVRWATRLTLWLQVGVRDGSDSWNVSCITAPFLNCPVPPGPDYDFGSAPNEITYTTASGAKTIIGAGQKSGIYYALDPDTGAELWRTQVGPGSTLGGIQWGSATDGKRIYVAISNQNNIPYAGGTAGSWSALDPATGAILWQVPDPNGAIDLGPMTVANDVVFACSMAGAANAPTMFALNAATGGMLWSFAAGSSVNAGATVVNGVVYWGSGYSHLDMPQFTGNNKFYAFSRN